MSRVRPFFLLLSSESRFMIISEGLFVQERGNPPQKYKTNVMMRTVKGDIFSILLPRLTTRLIKTIIKS